MGTPDVPSTLLPRSFQASRESSHTHMVLSPMEQGGCAVQLAGGAQQPSHRTAGMPPSCRVHLDGTQGQGQPVGACPRCPGSASNSQQDPGTPPLNAGHSSCAAGAGGHHHGSTHGKPRGVSTGSLGQGPACSCRSISLQRPGTDRTQGTSPAGGGCHGGSTDTRRRRLLPFRRQRASLLLLSCTLAHMAVAVAAVRQGGIHVRSLGGAEEATTGAAAECVPPMEMEPSAQFHLGCQRYRKMCIDQQQFVTYDPAFDPRVSTAKPPQFDVKDMVYNWPNPTGNGDKFMRGKDLKPNPVVIRVATSEEAAPDLQRPVFSNCTSPVVLWQRWIYNVGEVFESSFARVLAEYKKAMIDPKLTLVVATPHGLRLPKYIKVFFGSIFEKEVTTLAEFSARRHFLNEPSNATAEGIHVRCFETVTLCKIRNRMNEGLCGAGQHLLDHYAARGQLPSVEGAFGGEANMGADVLRVVFAARPNATGRVILNEEELVTACNAATPSQLAQGYDGPRKRLRCVAHAFGHDVLHDMALAQATDVLVAVHGAAGYHSFFLPRGGSLVEVLPYKFARSWANQYYATMLELDKKVFYWSVSITRANNSAESAFDGSEVFRPEMRGREHHVVLPWEALAQHLGSILQVNGDPLSYKQLYVQHQHSLTDLGQPEKNQLDLGENSWRRYKLRANDEQ